MFGFGSDAEDQGSGRAFVSAAQHDAIVMDATEWSNAYATSGSADVVGSPPLVAVQQPGPTWQDWFGMGKQTVTGLIDIFGRPVTPTGQVVAQPAPGIPLWGLVAIGVGGVVVLGVAARALRGRGMRRRYAGYRRHRKHRR